jgi:hypothetical protein
VQERLLLAVNPVVFTDILFQSPGSQFLLLFREPAGGAREVGQDPDGDESDNNGDSAFDDEKPAPRVD